MLREIEMNILRPRLFYGSITTSGGNTVSANIGGNDFSSQTEAGAGLPVLTFKQSSSRTPVVVAKQGSGVGNGAYTELAAASTGSVLSLKGLTNAGVAADGTIDYLACAFMSSDQNIVCPQLVHGSKRRTRIIWGKVTFSGGTPTVVIGARDFGISKTATGVYTITFKKAFAQTPSVYIQTFFNLVGAEGTPSSKTAAGCTVSMYDTSGVAADEDFYIVVIGADIRDEHGIAFGSVYSSQRNPRIIAGQITYSGGVPSATINANEFSSIGDTGTGVATLNLARPFKRECAIIATARAGRLWINTGSASAPALRASNAGGTAADPTTVDFFLIGSDDVSEY